MILGKKLAVVLPAYNAEHTLRRTVDALPPGVVDELILVDDASRDNTAALARSLGLRTLVHRVNLGYGGNQKTCYTEALARGADIVIMLHPDYQYDPRLVPAMAWLIASGLYDAVLASRIIGNGALRGGMPYYKYVANRVLTMTENLLLGEKLSEYHTGYRAFSRQVLETLPLEANSNDFVFDNEMLAQIFYFGFRVGEVSCPTRYEPESSSINFRRSCKYGLGVLWTALQYRAARLGLLQPALFSETSPRLDRERIRARVVDEKLSPTASAGPEAAAGIAGYGAAHPVPSSEPDPPAPGPSADAQSTELPPARRRGIRRLLQLLMAALLLGSLMPAVMGWRTIQAYAAIPRIAALPEADLVYARPDQRPLTNGQAVAVRDNGAVYLAEEGGQRLIAFPEGTSQSAITLAPRAVEEPLRGPSGLALGPDGLLYLLESGNGNVRVYTPDGDKVRTQKLASPGARAIALDDLGNVYIGDTGTGMVRKYLPSGEPDTGWGSSDTPGAQRVGPVNGLAVMDGSVFATTPGHITRLDEHGQKVFDHKTIGGTGMLAIAPGHGLVMSDKDTDRVWLLGAGGETLGRVVGPDGSEGLFGQPRGVAVSRDGARLYTVNDNRVTVYRLQWPG